MAKSRARATRRRAKRRFSCYAPDGPAGPGASDLGLHVAPVQADLAIEEELDLLGRLQTPDGEFVPAEAVRRIDQPRNSARLAARRAFRRALAFCCFS
jgi:hypothetical protein